MSDELLDRAIDAVARQMTAAAPPDAAAFRRRVLARLADKDVRRSWFDVRRSTFGVPRWVMIPVAAAIAIAVFVTRAPHQEKRPAPVDMSATAPTGRLRPDAPARAPSELPRPSTTVARVPAARPSPFAVASPDPPIQQNDVASIAVVPLDVDALSQESIQLERLDPIAPIAVAPLDITDTSRRNQ
jgi:hypothetical protein